jgi:hypothetical protein
MEPAGTDNSTLTGGSPAEPSPLFGLLGILYRCRLSLLSWSCSQSFSVLYDLARIATSSLALAVVSALYRMVLSWTLGKRLRRPFSLRP